MERDEVDQIRRKWGKQPCDHPSMAAVHEDGQSAGYSACVRCGRTVSLHPHDDVKEKLKNFELPKPSLPDLDLSNFDPPGFDLDSLG